MVWVFQQVTFTEAWEATRRANLTDFGIALALAVTFWFLLESRAFAYLFSRFHAPVSFGEARSMRGLAYLVTPINWNLGTAAIVLHLRRTKGIGALESAGSLLLYGALDGIVFTGLLLGGALLLPDTSSLAQIGRWAGLVLLCQTTFLLLVAGNAPNWSWLESLRRRRIFASLRGANLRDVFVLLTIRACYFAGFAAFFWLAPRAFDVHLPLPMVLAATPMVLGAGALPITPGGLGTQQAAMLYFFGPYGDEGAIVAFALAYPVALILGRLAVGMLYLGDLAAFRGTTSQDAATP
jgi:uncharacterized membrane protein YbhN (UPF0104 family)